MNSGKLSEREALKRLKSFQRRLRIREFERCVTNASGTGSSPAAKRGTTIRLNPTRKGIDIARRCFSAILTWLAAFRGLSRVAREIKNVMRVK